MVLPSYILEADRTERRPKEWNHSIIGGKNAHHRDGSEEELVLRSLSSGLHNVLSTISYLELVEDSIKNGISNITGLCYELGSQ